MILANLIPGAAIAFAISAALSFALARSRWSLWPQDKPNERSLHKTPTPRTGGLAVLSGLIAALLVTHGLPTGSSIWICAAATLLAAVSFVDDRKGLPAGVRFAAHGVAAAAAVWGAGVGVPRMWLPFFGDLSLGALAAPLSFLGILWLTNLYNFMDGIDGFAGSMTAIGCSFLSLAFWKGGDSVGAFVSVSLAASAAGFLLQNWPPARIFLGDVGAIPIGFLVSVLMARASAENALDIGASCLVFGPFILDATITVARRAFAGERIWSAHRSHYYQRLVLSGYPHARVTAWEIGLMVCFGMSALAFQGANGTVRTALLAACVAISAAAIATVRSVECRLGERPRTILIVSQVFVPDPAAVGQHLADVAFEMARRGFTVKVLTSARGYDDPSRIYSSREVIEGVRIRRLPLSSFGKASIPVRLAAQALFIAQACMHGLFAGSVDGVLVSTSPPFSGIVAVFLSVVRRVPLVYWVMDLNPDQTIAIGKLRAGSVAVRLLDALNRITLARASSVIALDDYMAARLNAKCDVAEKLIVLPPWPAAEASSPKPAAENGFRRRYGLVDDFVVMYAGNHSPANPLDTLLAAAEELRNQPRLRFVFIGGGEGKSDVDGAISRGAKNILSLPYQPLATIAETLSAADLHVVSIGNAMVGIIHPSKIYGAMATGVPILSFGPDLSSPSRIVSQYRIGWHVAHGDVSRTVSVIEYARGAIPGELAEMGQRARLAIDESFGRTKLVGAFCDLLERASYGGLGAR